MASDRSWIRRRNGKYGLTEEFVCGVADFLKFAYAQTNFIDGHKIRCPCRKCKNLFFRDSDSVTYHLYRWGFLDGYTLWDAHGENRNLNTGSTSTTPSNDVSTNPYRQMVVDMGGCDFEAPISTCPDNNAAGDRPNSDAAQFYALLRAADEPLWEGCLKHSKLSALTQLLNIKAEFHMPEKCFNRILQCVNDMLPIGRELEKNFYKTKRSMAKLGLGYEKIDACVNNCTIFYKEQINLLRCPVCGHARYKKAPTNRHKGVAFKVLRFLPLTPRLQRLYLSTKTSSYMTWHASHRCEDGKMAHPSDGDAWKHFNDSHPSFASDARNVRLGLCSDGFSPFGQYGAQYSCWPVITTVYNLPPWMCMTDPYMFLTLVIPGPKHPGKDIDVFMRPLIDELSWLWNIGATTYDSSRRENFQMKAALMWTISDFPAYGMLSGWCTHGKLACPYCMESSKAFGLKNGRKASFFDCHRQFLPRGHPFRKQKDRLKKGVIEDGDPLVQVSGDEILERVSILPAATSVGQIMCRVDNVPGS